MPGGPLGLDVSEGHAWVVATDAGQLVDIDLTLRHVDEPRHRVVGELGQGPRTGRASSSAATRPNPDRATLEFLDIPGGDVTPVFEDPIDALDLDGDTIWAFEKKGTVLRVAADGRIVGQVPSRSPPTSTSTSSASMIRPSRHRTAPRSAASAESAQGRRDDRDRRRRPLRPRRPSSGARDPTSSGPSTPPPTR